MKRYHNVCINRNNLLSMNIETKLSNLVKLLSLSNLPNQQKLLEGYENLKKLLSYSQPLPHSVITLKTNPFYRQFKLDTDPQFLKVLINRAEDIPIIENLLKLEINYSIYEEYALKQRLNTLIILSILEDDLEEAAEYDESQNADEEEFEVYFEDLKELKAIFFAEKITPKNIEWFLHSDLFDFISNAADCFDASLIDIYQALLDSAEIKTKKNFIEHKTILIEKANKAIKDQEPFDIKGFLSVLDAKKNNLITVLPSASKHSNKHSFYKSKIPKMATFSPLARQAMMNNFKKI